MIQCSVESNLFPEPLIGEYDQVENQIRTKGNRGKGDLHISRSLGPWVVVPGQLENVGNYSLQEKESFQENFNSVFIEKSEFFSKTPYIGLTRA